MAKSVFRTIVGLIGFATLMWQSSRGLRWLIGFVGDMDFVAKQWQLHGNKIMNVLEASWFSLVAIPVGFVFLYLALHKPLSFSNWLKAIRMSDEKTDTSTKLDSNTNADEVLQHIIVEGRRRDSLEVQKAFTPWRVRYPLHLRNTRPLPVDIIGYIGTILWDDSEIQRIEWEAPDSEASNGMQLRPNGESVKALTLEPDSPYTLHIPFNVSQAPNPPIVSPRWSIRGRLMLKCDNSDYIAPFDFQTDYYEIPQDEWQGWLAQVDPRL